jgi:hypothetical protein
MAAMAIDKDAAQAHLAHLAEGDLHRAPLGVTSLTPHPNRLVLHANPSL